MDMKHLLVDTFVHLRPAHVLEDLSEPQARDSVPNAPHSMVEIVAHMEFWQDWFLKRCQGEPAPLVASAATGWPTVADGGWPDLRERFLNGLDRAAALGARPGILGERVTPAIEFPPLAQYTIGEALMHVAQHNSHHLGQIITMRQVLRMWPPPAGSWTW